MPSIINRLNKKDITVISTWLIFIKDSILSSTYVGSWYLVSSIFSAWFVYLLSKRLQTKTINGITFGIYLTGVFTSSYCVLPTEVEKILSFLCFPLNIFCGCFYFSLGKYIYENRNSIIKIFDKKRSVIGFIIFYLIFIIEIYLTRKFKVCRTTDMTFSIVFASILLFLFCLQVNIKTNYTVLLRKLSVIIFCSQGNVLLIKNFIRKKNFYSSIVAYLISVIVIFVICCLVLHIQNKNRWKFSKYLT